ncbi:hypothetical protein [Methylovirgula sp. HY1]|uniref:hypothetical protein n=1 Tax=Methylovirgula sp. HY1 TaxID=2822761 RepID=UPI001C5AC0B8|nr:hypothetical protein [Methylovirgula sp. HY1]
MPETLSTSSALGLERFPIGQDHPIGKTLQINKLEHGEQITFLFLKNSTPSAALS